MVYLDEAVHASGDQHLAIRRKAGDFRVALFAELKAAVQRRRVLFNL